MDNLPEWKKFEHIITELQEQITPEAKVTSDYKYKDLEGEIWQIDVLIDQKVGLLNYRTIIECKDRNHTISRAEIDGFVEKMKTVKAHAGYVISKTPFSKGAKQFAKRRNFKLMEYREAEEADWKNLLGEDVWTNVIKIVQPLNWKLLIQLKNMEIIEGELNTALFDFQGNEINALKDYVIKQLRAYGMFQPFENLTLTLDMNVEEPVFIQLYGNNYLPVLLIKMQGDLDFKIYKVNLSLYEGDVVVDTEENKEAFVRLKSETFTLEEIEENLEGTVLSQEEFLELVNQGSHLISVDKNQPSPEMRFVVQYKPD